MNPPDTTLPVAVKARLWRGLPWLVLTLGVALSGVVYLENRENLEAQQSAIFQSEVRKAVEMIEARMGTYLQILRATGGLLKTQPQVSREQFHKFIDQQGVGTDHTGIQGVGFARLIRPQELQAHIASVRREGVADYAIQPEGERPLYSSIVYIAPALGRNLRAIGYDMYAEPVRHRAMQRAADTGEMSLSGKVRLVQETGRDEQAGFLVYAPLYREGMPLTGVEERRAHLVGWVYAPFRMNDFLTGIYGERAGNLLIDIYDGTDATPANLMHTEQATWRDPKDKPSAIYETVQTLHLMGHTWTLHMRASDLMLSRIDTRLPALLGLGGVLMSLVLALLIQVLVTRRERAIAMAIKMNKALVQERAKLSAIIAGTHAGTWEWNVQTGETTFNAHWAQLIGYQLSELEPTSIETWTDRTHPDDLKTSRALLQQHFDGQLEYYECEARMRHKDGHWIWVLDRGQLASRTPDGKPLMMCGTRLDITHHKQLEESYKHGAHHDQLTGLPNRTLLADRLEHSLLVAQRNHEALALMFMDIDGFKLVNDTHGHDAGDLVLQTMARRIQRCIRASDTLARIGGDEFVVLLPDVTDEHHAWVLAEKIGAIAREPIPLAEGATARVSLSIGIALYPEHGQDAATLTEHADQAMYKVKKGGKNAAEIYHEDRAADLAA